MKNTNKTRESVTEYVSFPYAKSTKAIAWGYHSGTSVHFAKQSICPYLAAPQRRGTGTRSRNSRPVTAMTLFTTRSSKSPKSS